MLSFVHLDSSLWNFWIIVRTWYWNRSKKSKHQKNNNKSNWEQKFNCRMSRLGLHWNLVCRIDCFVNFIMSIILVEYFMWTILSFQWKFGWMVNHRHSRPAFEFEYCRFSKNAHKIVQHHSGTVPSYFVLSLNFQRGYNFCDCFFLSKSASAEAAVKLWRLGPWSFQ